jgi:hypothetical protein
MGRDGISVGRDGPAAGRDMLAAAHDGTVRLYEGGRVHTPDGRARFAPTPHAAPLDAVDDDWPLLLTTGRLADQWHTMTRTGKSAALRAAAGAPTIGVHPDDVPGIADGDRVRVASRRGEVMLRAALDPALPRGVAFAPFHFGALHAPPGAGQLNDTVPAAVDPVSKQPELKAVAVRLSPAGAASAARRGNRAGRLVIVGTGMAGLAVAEEVLRRDPSWRITMLGEEPVPTYNRILLSRLLAGECGPGALELRPRAWYAAHGIDLRAGCPAAAIDTAARTVRDAAGEVHEYDALVLATGSRPFVPPIPGTEHAHVFRTRADVEALTAAGARRAVVMGGGLLGLEAAAGLRALGAQVTVVEAAPRLMGRQLDAGAAAMLERALAARGIPAVTGRVARAIERAPAPALASAEAGTVPDPTEASVPEGAQGTVPLTVRLDDGAELVAQPQAEPAAKLFTHQHGAVVAHLVPGILRGLQQRPQLAVGGVVGQAEHLDGLIAELGLRPRAAQNGSHLAALTQPGVDLARLRVTAGGEIDVSREAAIEPAIESRREAADHRADTDVDRQRQQQRHQRQRQSGELLTAVGPRPQRQRPSRQPFAGAQDEAEHHRQEQRGAEQEACEHDEAGDQAGAKNERSCGTRDHNGGEDALPDQPALLCRLPRIGLRGRQQRQSQNLDQRVRGGRQRAKDAHR